MAFLDIHSHDIQGLPKETLQELVRRLCAAELAARGLPPTGVVSGDNMNAADGGVDIMVNTDSRISECGFIPKGQTAFQVKQTPMPPSKIKKEMRGGNGRLNAAVARVLKSGGAYIITCGKDSVSPAGIEARKKTMQEAAIPGARVDFYDSARIAEWVRYHSPITKWLRKQMKQSAAGLPGMPGVSYDEWSASHLRGQNKTGYVVDKDILLIDRRRGKEMPVKKGIAKIREQLRQSNSAVRIVGLSGMGKTRLALALFDPKVRGGKPLNKHWAIYADSSRDSDSSLINLAEDLAAKKEPVFLVVDNCSQKLHRELTSVCSENNRVKLITIELDIRDDIPESTSAFQLKCESKAVVEELIMENFKNINQADRARIAEFCGGNPRMGLILAELAKDTGGLATVRDAEFLNRLFRDADEQLKRTAEVCSLVYSFGVDGEYGQELAILADLIDQKPKAAYSKVADLLGRGIAQKRGDMRAILPDALANRFATNALEHIPNDAILSDFLAKGNERLLRSFSRRLGYLHSHEKAQAIAKDWLASDLRDIPNRASGDLRDLRMEVLQNIAPVQPKLTLEFIKRAADNGVLSREFPYVKEYMHLLFNLAYEEEDFDAAADLLVRMALSDYEHTDREDVRKTLCSLFGYSLSGTYAPLKKRLAFIKKTIEAEEEEEWQLGLRMLSSTMSRSGSRLHLLHAGFGARSRGFGYNAGRDRDWFKECIGYAAELAASKSPVASEAMSMLAKQFRELWTVGLDVELEDAAHEIAKHGNSHEMAIAVLETIRFEGERMSEARRKRLLAIKELFAPANLQDKFKMLFVADGEYHIMSHTNLDGEPADAGQADKSIRDLGADIARSESDFKALLRDMLTVSHHELVTLGRGLADGCDDCRRMWGDFHSNLSGIAKDKQILAVPAGFITGVAQNPKTRHIAVEILEQVVTDDIFARFYPRLEPFNEKLEGAAGRVQRSIDFGKAPAHEYKFLAWGGHHKIFNDETLAGIVNSLMSIPNGIDAAIEILSMRFYNEGEGHTHTNPAIIKCCRDVVGRMSFSYRDMSGGISHSVGKIVGASFRGSDAEPAARKLCQKLARALQKGKLHAEHYILHPLAQMHPEIFLDEFLVIKDTFYLNEISSAVAKIEDHIVDWCEKHPAERYPQAAVAVRSCRTAENKKKEFTPIAQRIINNAPDKAKVLKHLWRGFYPMIYSGSRVPIIDGQLELCATLQKHDNPEVVQWAKRQEKYLKEERQWALENEDKDDDSAPSSFE